MIIMIAAILDCARFGCFSAIFEPHRFGTVVGSDSVAERANPLLLMLTDEI